MNRRQAKKIATTADRQLNRGRLLVARRVLNRRPRGGRRAAAPKRGTGLRCLAARRLDVTGAPVVECATWRLDYCAGLLMLEDDPRAELRQRIAEARQPGGWHERVRWPYGQDIPF